MSPPLDLGLDLGPPPRLSFAEGAIERAAEQRGDAAARAVLERDERARTYIAGGEMVVLRQATAETPHDPLFTLAEAQALGGTKEAIFLGLVDGAPRFAL